VKRVAWLLAVLAGACHGGTSPATIDGAATPDAAVDATADASVDAAVSPFSFVPASLDFGYVPPGTVSAPIHLTVVSSITGDIPNFSLSFTGDDTAEIQISQTTCSSTFNSDCMMDIEFAPQTAGDHMMQITASAPGQISASAPIHAIGGIAPHPFGQGSSYLDFGTVIVGDISGQLVTYHNWGTTTLPPITFMFAGESPDQYYLSNDHCTGVQLGPMETCTVVVVYAPTSLMTPGAAVLYGTAVDTDELDLRADPAAATTLSISPTSYDFGSVGPGPSGNVPFTITNTGSTIATGFSSTIYNSQFSVTSSTCTSLAPGATCEMDVQLAPTATGPDGGGMTVYAANATSAGTGFTAIGIPAEGVILDTWSHDFGTAQVGTTGSNYTFTVTNVGTVATTIALSLDDATTSFEIAQDNCSATSLGAGSTCTFEIIYVPQMATSLFARVHVTSSSNDAIAHLTGVATPADQPLHVIPSDYNYSTDAIGQILSEEFTVASQGGTTKVPTMSLTGPNASEFQIVNDQCSGVSLASGQSCLVDVWYRPATVGTGKSASLIADWGTGTWTATLEAGAFEDSNAFVTSDPPSLDFGTVAVGQSASITLPFKNYGATTSPPVSMMLSGINPTEFSLTNDTCTNAVLINGEGCTVTVVFTPMSTGTKHADLQVTIADGGDPHLTGVGQ
jgi:hypothetical protein